jgi:phosphoglycerate dehydrogenase-like enzyme
MKIVFHGGNAANFRTGFETMLDGLHTIASVGDTLATPEERAQFESADVIIGIRLTATDPAPRQLKLYHAPAAGTDAIDINCFPAGAALCNCFGHEDAIAEYVMAALLLRHVPIPDADARLRNGDWTYWAGRPGALRSELGGRTIGLLGFGHIGRVIAARAKAFGMRVVVANRSLVPTSASVDQSFGLDRLEDFMSAADIIVTSLPLLDETRGIVGTRAFAAMRAHAIIMNVGRGPVIDEKALFDALSQNRIGGAIIDTWYTYPTPEKPETLPSSLPFHTLTNVVLTPHMSGWTNGTVRRRQATMADNIARLARGEPLENVVARR